MTLQSFNPATLQLVWEGPITTNIPDKIKFAKKAFSTWSKTPLQERIQFLESYGKQLEENTELPIAISKETGKPLWESKAEVKAMIDKIPLSIEAFKERCAILQTSPNLSTRFRPHGIVAVLGPFNFPGHLPNGHIVPALLAGNTVLFKPSELTPYVGELMNSAFSSFPEGVFQLILGGPEEGKVLVTGDVDAIFFTGSSKTGEWLKEQCPHKLLALEMGGNNPLVVSKIHDIKTAAYMIIQSAFLTTGQRCSASRRLILTPDCDKKLIDELIDQMKRLVIGRYDDPVEPFMGPLIHLKAAKELLNAQATLKKQGAKVLYPMTQANPGLPFVTPALIDVTSIKNRQDVEYFGPFLQLIHTSSLNEALIEANNTSYGLTAGLFSDSSEEWDHFYSEIKAGVVNWNAPLTGASSRAPFGGLGKSGNFHPSGYLAADYCSYPVASTQNPHLTLPATLTPGTHP